MNANITLPYQHGQLCQASPLLTQKQLALLGNVAASHAAMETKLNTLLLAFCSGWPCKRCKNWERDSFRNRLKLLRAKAKETLCRQRFDKDLLFYTEHLLRLHKARNVMLHGLFSIALEQSGNQHLVTAEYEKKLGTFLFNDAQINELAYRLSVGAGTIEMLLAGKLTPWFSKSDTGALRNHLSPHIRDYRPAHSTDYSKQLAFLL